MKKRMTILSFVICLNTNAQVCFISPAANFGVGAGSDLRSVISADFNGDGKADLAVANWNSPTLLILLGTGTGSFGAAINYTVGSSPMSLTSADFNGDGKADLAVANMGSNNVSVLLNTGTGSFLAAINFAVGTNPTSVISADFNGDGKADLALTNTTSSNLSVLLGTGTGSFGPATSFTAGLNPRSVTSADFNGDGKTDLAVANYNNSNDVSVLLGTGTGSFLAAVNFTVGSQPISIINADFNGDGFIDLAVANSNSANISVLFGTGIGSFGAAINFGLGANPASIASADFNGDGKTDLVVPIYVSSIISVLLGTGTGSFDSPVNFAVGPNPRSVTSADFNGDARADLAFVNQTSNSVSVFLNKLPTIYIVSSSSSVCLGTSATISAGGAITYSWSTGATTQSETVSPITSSIYTVIGTDLNNCSNTETVSVTVDNTCADVWPGDANSDGIADNLDVLELGLHYTQLGAPRSATSNTWQSYFANNWVGTITNGANLNHSDCNGDGTINDDDTLAIYNNYSLTHAFKTAQTNTVNPQLSIVPDQVMVTKGTWGTASVYLGDATNTINSINGIAFTVDFDNTLIEPNSIYIEYQNSFLDASQNLHFRKPDFANGKIFTATTHTVNNDVSGFGKIATLHYQILSSLATDQTLTIGLSQANQSDASGLIAPLTSGAGTLMAVGSSVGIKETLNSGNVSISPNPTNGILNIAFSTIPQNTKIEVYNSIGALVLTETLSNKNNTINTSQLSNGMYLIKVLENNRITSVQKIVKQ